MPIPGESSKLVPGHIHPPVQMTTRSQKKRAREEAHNSAALPRPHNATQREPRKPPLHPSTLKRVISEPELELPPQESSSSMGRSSSSLSGRSSPSTYKEYIEDIHTPPPLPENRGWGIYDKRFYGGQRTRARRTRKRKHKKSKTRKASKGKGRSTRSKKSKTGGRKSSRRRR